ncbi:M91 family zinc metallopeptidase [Pseudomonas sp. LF245]
MEVSKSLANANYLPLKREHDSPQHHVATFDNSHYVPAVPPQRVFTPDNPIQAHIQPILDDGNLKACGQSLWEQDVTYSLKNSLILETSNKADQIHIRQTRPGQLDVQVNGRLYRFDSHDKDGRPVTFHLKTHGGDDNIRIDANVTQPVIVDAGDGDDRVHAGGGYTRLFGGKGDDVLRLGSGLGYAEGNDGNDTLIGGTGDNTLYGNNGNDRLYAGAGPKSKTSNLDGGNGNDRLYAGSGHTVLHGGAGNDRLIGHDRSTFYTGDGRDAVIANRPGDLIYAQPDDTINHLNGSLLTAVSADPEPQTGLVIKGSTEFIQRVEDDLALLRLSPNGKQMLAAMSAIAQRNGAPVTLVEDLLDTGSGYVYGSQELKTLFGHEHAPVVGDDPKWGFMVNGVPGSRADRAQISYSRSAVETVAGVTYAPITVLYHEMVHAWNAANGNALAGTTTTVHDGKLDETPNSELQAVGLPTTPANTLNPKALTENALNEEMGKPLRTQYIG